jgi:hypothetical protein
VNEAGVKEHSLGNGCFSGINVGDNADVADILDTAGHKSFGNKSVFVKTSVITEKRELW